jgi:hypothetical protein
MPPLQPMPPIVIDPNELAPFGQRWAELDGALSRSTPYSSGQLGEVFDRAVGASLAEMLGGIPIVQLGRNNGLLIPPQPNCVEVGPFLVIGGVRPQHFDVGYRPDGVRFAFDSKTLNDAESVKKNWQNMVNDLATEATTVHTRFPNAVVGFLVALPAPVIHGSRLAAMVGTLERITGRSDISDPEFRAEAISLVLWNPENGSIDQTTPSLDSPLRIERFSEQVESAYRGRYKGLPPHAE